MKDWTRKRPGIHHYGVWQEGTYGTKKQYVPVGRTDEGLDAKAARHSSLKCVSVNSAAKNLFISQPSLYVELALFWLGKDT